MYIIGDDIDKNFSLEVKPPKTIYGTSEYNRPDDMYQLILTAPHRDGDPETKTFRVHLYASNSRSIPYSFHKDNYWEGLIPTWKFFDENKDVVEDLPVTVTKKSNEDKMIGTAKFHYVDDMPSTNSAICIWATLNLDETTFKDEIVKSGNLEYQPPSYANSKVIAVCSTIINAIRPTRLSVKRNAYDSISTGTYWGNQIIPFVVTVNSDHFNGFRSESEQIDPYYKGKDGDVTSEIVYNYPYVPGVKTDLIGSLVLPINTTAETDNRTLVEKYEYFTKNNWAELSSYSPPTAVLPGASGAIPPPDILEKMDFYTYDDIISKYVGTIDDISTYFERVCNDPDNCPGATYANLHLNSYVSLVKNHPEFDYVPYALKVIGTLSSGSDGEMTLPYSNISAMSGSGVPQFELLDQTDDCNYMVGGYAFGKVVCPDLGGNNLVGTINATTEFSTSAFDRTDFKLFTYWIAEEDVGIRAIGDLSTMVLHEDEIVKFIGQPIEKQYVNNNMPITDFIKSQEMTRFLNIGGLVEVSCVVQDPLYNAWVSDAGTGMLYKFDLNGNKLLQVDLNSAIQTYITRLPSGNEKTELQKYWNETKGPGLSPTHMVLDSKGNLYVTCFDSKFFFKVDSANGKLLNVFGFPTSEVQNATIGFNDSWRPVGVDTNEFDDVAVLFRVDPSSSTPETSSTNLYGFDHNYMVVMFDGMTNEFTGDHFSLSPFGYGKLCDVPQFLFRSTEDEDTMYVSETCIVSDKQISSLYKYVKESDESWSHAAATSSGFATLIASAEEDDPSKFENSLYDHLFIDADDTLWWTYGNKLYYRPSSATENTLCSITGVETITGISQTSNKNILFVCKMNDGDYYFKQYDPNKTPDPIVTSEKLEPLDQNNPTPFYARGDWTGIDWMNKYMKSLSVTLETSPDENKINLYSYENYYVRKKNEEFDVPEHMKIPIKGSSFELNNPVLFDAIGESLGINEHKHYSIGKKLYEGIANQVANIHDIDECHIDSIYAISKKEDVPIDKFILAYPEELRRMSDLVSIKRKKLWGEICHCNQNYFKTKTDGQTRLCPYCQHVHGSNLGPSFYPYEQSIWKLVEEKRKDGFGVIKNTWFKLRANIAELGKLLNEMYDIPDDEKLIEDESSIKTMIGAIDPVNRIFNFTKKYFTVYEKRLTTHSTTYDVVRILNGIYDFIKDVPTAYIVENKFNRGVFQRIMISKESYDEAMELYKSFEAGTYLDENDMQLMEQGKTNDKIIMFLSLRNYAEELEKQMSCATPEFNKTIEEKIKYGCLLAFHTSFFVPDHWFNYCYYKFNPTRCDNHNVGVIDWETKYTTMDPTDTDIMIDWLDDDGMMTKLINYILHNGTLFHRDEEYIDD